MCATATIITYLMIFENRKMCYNTDMEKSEMVGRAELKLKEAAEAFSYDFRGKVVLDIGSSTGGFTEYALRRGATKVIAIEKGTRQMKAPLRFDPRVELHEKTDIFTLRFEPISGERCLAPKDQDNQKVRHMPRLSDGVTIINAKRPDVILADVSFVSLTKVLMYAKMELACRNTDYFVMLKPQFEADERQLNRGVVKNERMRREIIRKFEEWLKRNGFLVVKKRDNETVGKVGGNRERFYLLKSA